MVTPTEHLHINRASGRTRGRTVDQETYPDYPELVKVGLFTAERFCVYG